jgi:uncharacterized protein (TIGR03084 family)
MPTDVFDAVAEEYAALGAMLAALEDAAWAHPSLCAGWSVADVVLHLAQTEEGVVSSTSGTAGSNFPRERTTTIDEAVERTVSSERGQSGAELLERWTKASRASLAALREADPSGVFAWATNPLKPRTLATTRLSEHWIHANDISQPLGIDYPDTDRIWHIARLAHRTIPYAYARAGRDDPATAFLELESPGGGRWAFGDQAAECHVRGPASEFCRIAARRLDPADAAGIVATGARAGELLSLVRTYA